MASQHSLEISEAVKDLIIRISGCDENIDLYTQIQKKFVNKLKKADTMYFLSKREVDERITGMCDKFISHGLFLEAQALQKSYKIYVKSDLPNPELMTRLNIVQFLLCMSERPTSKLFEVPYALEIDQRKEEEEKEPFNWTEYMNEGLEGWEQKFDESSDSSGTSSIAEESNDTDDVTVEDIEVQLPVIITSVEKFAVADLRANREELLNTIQHTWFNKNYYRDVPFSKKREANVGIIWETFLKKQAMGLLVWKNPTVLSEYKIIREILWQLWCTHSSSVFELVGNNLSVKSNVTISSIREITFKTFLEKEFLPSIELLQFFREFSKSLATEGEEYFTSVPQTYRSYNNSIQNILGPVYTKLSELENKVREQESIYTLLNLSDDFQNIMQPVFLLKKIHELVVIDFKQNNNLTCALTLLFRLQNSLQFSVNKLDQDLRVTLLLESLYYYFTLIDSWLMKNELTDYSREFVINNRNQTHIDPDEGNADSSTSETNLCSLNFDLNEGKETAALETGVIKIIRESVLQIGRNLHFLRLLGKLYLMDKCKETIHQEFLRKSLEELCKFFNRDPKEFISIKYVDVDSEDNAGLVYKYPVISTEECRRPTDMDRLENLVDTTDGFLMLAFEDYFMEGRNEVEPIRPTVFEEVSKITTSFFPTANFFEKVLNGILKERFTISGLMVKNVLIEQYFLESQFRFLRHLFLFFDDMIFPFYRRIFEKTNSHSKNWGNKICMTSNLQDIIVDIYPEFYEKCTVAVKDNWKLCSDSLEACSMVSLQYEIQWPLNIIITSIQMDLYKDIFQFILKIKWGLYTLNHLVFTDLEPRRKNSDKTKSVVHRTTIMRLNYMKFSLTNLLNSIQHYIFSFVFTKCFQKFELEFEKANDLTSIMASHAEFINTIYSMTMDIRNSGEGSAFENVTICIKVLKMMWNNIANATPSRLHEYYRIYEQSYKYIDPVINPVYIF